MDFRRLSLLFHTLRYLRFKQLYYRGYYLIRNRFFKKTYSKVVSKEITALHWQETFLYTDSYKTKNSFTFLNISQDFKSEINWNHKAYGKLWTYNLNYFDFLQQETITAESGLKLILAYLEKDNSLVDGKEPYPISLRGINWVKFLSKYAISNAEVNQQLRNHYEILFHNLEYHILGNHLLENGFSLFFGGYYFKDEVLYHKAIEILREELNEQVLMDGAHFELSPMYHQIMLHRLLDCINLATLNSWKEDGLVSFLKEKAVQMLGWLQEVTYSNGNIPMVNDCAYGIAPTSEQLFAYANTLQLNWNKIKLDDSGYRKFSNAKYELFVDVGRVGPTYQPGHAHADIFNFELYVGQKPIIVDTGTSTYEKNELRQLERATASHNTVKIGNIEQSQVWGGFRVAKRAKVSKLEETEGYIKAEHNGYSALGVEHTRSFTSETSRIVIEDLLNKAVEEEQIAYFHLHPSVTAIEIIDNKVVLGNSNIQFIFDTPLKIELLPYTYALGFNKTVKANKIAVSFNQTLTTIIDL